MIAAIIALLILAIVLFIVWRILGLFITDAKIMTAIGLLFGLILLLAAVSYFFPAVLPFHQLR
jgi:hypothetical protein